MQCEPGQPCAQARQLDPADLRDLPIDTHFTGYGRSGTDADGGYWFLTIKPGAVPFDDRRLQAPHICVTVFARGLLNHLYTRLYFADDPATAGDPLLDLVPAERRATLLLTVRAEDYPAQVALPDLASRLRAARPARLSPPDDLFLRQVLVKLLADRQLSVSPPVLDYLVTRMERTFAAASAVPPAVIVGRRMASSKDSTSISVECSVSVLSPGRLGSSNLRKASRSMERRAWRS